MSKSPLPTKVSNLIRKNKNILTAKLKHYLFVFALSGEDMHRTYPNMSLFDKGSQTNENSPSDSRAIPRTHEFSHNQTNPFMNWQS